jgi:hypothetical protein
VRYTERQGSIRICLVKFRKQRWAGHVTRVEKIRNEIRICVVERLGRRLLGRSGRRWKDNIVMNREVK